MPDSTGPKDAQDATGEPKDSPDPQPEPTPHPEPQSNEGAGQPQDADPDEGTPTATEPDKTIGRTLPNGAAVMMIHDPNDPGKIVPGHKHAGYPDGATDPSEFRPHPVSQLHHSMGETMRLHQEAGLGKDGLGADMATRSAVGATAAPGGGLYRFDEDAVPDEQKVEGARRRQIGGAVGMAALTGLEVISGMAGRGMSMVNRMIRAVLSGNPLSAPSTMFAQTVGAMGQVDSEIRSAYEKYGVALGVDPQSIRETEKGKKLLQARRNQEQGWTEAYQEVDGAMAEVAQGKDLDQMTPEELQRLDGMLMDNAERVQQEYLDRVNDGTLTEDEEQRLKAKMGVYASAAESIEKQAGVNAKRAKETAAAIRTAAALDRRTEADLKRQEQREIRERHARQMEEAEARGDFARKALYELGERYYDTELTDDGVPIDHQPRKKYMQALRDKAESGLYSDEETRAFKEQYDRCKAYEENAERERRDRRWSEAPYDPERDSAVEWVLDQFPQNSRSIGSRGELNGPQAALRAEKLFRETAIKRRRYLEERERARSEGMRTATYESVRRLMRERMRTQQGMPPTPTQEAMIDSYARRYTDALMERRMQGRMLEVLYGDDDYAECYTRMHLQDVTRTKDIIGRKIQAVTPGYMDEHGLTQRDKEDDIERLQELSDELFGPHFSRDPDTGEVTFESMVTPEEVEAYHREEDAILKRWGVRKDVTRSAEREVLDDRDAGPRDMPPPEDRRRDVPPGDAPPPDDQDQDADERHPRTIKLKGRDTDFVKAQGVAGRIIGYRGQVPYLDDPSPGQVYAAMAFRDLASNVVPRNRMGEVSMTSMPDSRYRRAITEHAGRSLPQLADIYRRNAETFEQAGQDREARWLRSAAETMDKYANYCAIQGAVDDIVDAVGDPDERTRYTTMLEEVLGEVFDDNEPWEGVEGDTYESLKEEYKREFLQDSYERLFPPEDRDAEGQDIGDQGVPPEDQDADDQDQVPPEDQNVPPEDQNVPPEDQVPPNDQDQDQDVEEPQPEPEPEQEETAPPDESWRDTDLSRVSIGATRHRLAMLRRQGLKDSEEYTARREGRVERYKANRKLQRELDGLDGAKLKGMRDRIAEELERLDVKEASKGLSLEEEERYDANRARLDLIDGRLGEIPEPTEEQVRADEGPQVSDEGQMAGELQAPMSEEGQPESEQPQDERTRSYERTYGTGDRTFRRPRFEDPEDIRRRIKDQSSPYDSELGDEYRAIRWAHLERKRQYRELGAELGDMNKDIKDIDTTVKKMFLNSKTLDDRQKALDAQKALDELKGRRDALRTEYHANKDAVERLVEDLEQYPGEFKELEDWRQRRGFALERDARDRAYDDLEKDLYTSMTREEVEGALRQAQSIIAEDGELFQEYGTHDPKLYDEEGVRKLAYYKAVRDIAQSVLDSRDFDANPGGEREPEPDVSEVGQPSEEGIAPSDVEGIVPDVPTAEGQETVVPEQVDTSEPMPEPESQPQPEQADDRAYEQEFPYDYTYYDGLDDRGSHKAFQQLNRRIRELDSRDALTDAERKELDHLMDVRQMLGSKGWGYDKAPDGEGGEYAVFRRPKASDEEVSETGQPETVTPSEAPAQEEPEPEPEQEEGPSDWRSDLTTNPLRRDPAFREFAKVPEMDAVPNEDAVVQSCTGNADRGSGRGRRKASIFFDDRYDARGRSLTLFGGKREMSAHPETVARVERWDTLVRENLYEMFPEIRNNLYVRSDTGRPAKTGDSALAWAVDRRDNLRAMRPERGTVEYERLAKVESLVDAMRSDILRTKASEDERIKAEAESRGDMTSRGTNRRKGYVDIDPQGAWGTVSEDSATLAQRTRMDGYPEGSFGEFLGTNGRALFGGSDVEVPDGDLPKESGKATERTMEFLGLKGYNGRREALGQAVKANDAVVRAQLAELVPEARGALYNEDGTPTAVSPIELAVGMRDRVLSRGADEVGSDAEMRAHAIAMVDVVDRAMRAIDQNGVAPDVSADATAREREARGRRQERAQEAVEDAEGAEAPPDGDVPAEGAEGASGGARASARRERGDDGTATKVMRMVGKELGARNEQRRRSMDTAVQAIKERFSREVADLNARHRSGELDDEEYSRRKTELNDAHTLRMRRIEDMLDPETGGRGSWEEHSKGTPVLSQEQVDALVGSPDDASPELRDAIVGAERRRRQGVEDALGGLDEPRLREICAVSGVPVPEGARSKEELAGLIADHAMRGTANLHEVIDALDAMGETESAKGLVLTERKAIDDVTDALGLSPWQRGEARRRSGRDASLEGLRTEVYDTSDLEDPEVMSDAWTAIRDTDLRDLSDGTRKEILETSDEFDRALRRHRLPKRRDRQVDEDLPLGLRAVARYDELDDEGKVLVREYVKTLKGLIEADPVYAEAHPDGVPLPKVRKVADGASRRTARKRA